MDTAAPLLVVGLGNPGAKYRETRHNIGFLAVEELARRQGWTFAPGAGPWREAGAAGGDGPLVLLQPLTWMNLSGEAVAGWAAAHGWPPAAPPPRPLPPAAASGSPLPADPTDPGAAAAIPAADPVPRPWEPPWRPLVICDDLALPLGALRLRARGSSGGQKGLASVIECLGHDDFPRLRLGIAPADRPVPPAAWPDYVLTAFAPAELEAVADLVARAADAVLCCREQGVEAAASRFNRR